jgi:tRNA (guanine26-N2/guanine27-N2)-dimethyltransferase
LRIKKEAKVKNVYVNDANPVAVSFIKQNARLNKLRVNIYGLRAHEFLATRYKLKHKKFGYLDIDPFGTPTPFLDAGVKAITEHNGVIAVTATDTSALCGTYPAACLRKYGAKPLYNYLMNETGLRILIKKVQEVAAQYDIGLTPVFSHTTRHYMRAYLRAEYGADKTDNILKQIGFYKGAGPMWLGSLWDANLVERMQKLAVNDKFISEAQAEYSSAGPRKTGGFAPETKNLLYKIAQEAKIPIVGFFDLAEMKLKQVPKMQKVIETLWAKGFAAARTHFSPTGIKTNASEKEFSKLLRVV